MKRSLYLAVPTLTLLLSIGGLELGFGGWLSQNPWDRALALRIVVDRTLTYDASDLYKGGGRVVYTRDGYGLRGAYGTPDAITVLTIGGSTTDQRFITDGQTWQDELQRRLRAAGKPATVANAGVNGHSTFAHLASYDVWFPLIPGLRPRYTIVYVGINDVLATAPLVPWEGTADGTSTLQSRIKANSALFRLYADVHDRLTGRARPWGTPVDFSRVRYTDRPWLADPGALGAPHVPTFESRFTALLRRVQATGSTPICVTQPTALYRVEPNGRVRGADLDVSFEASTPTEPFNGVDYFHLRRMIDEVMLGRCAEADAPALDLALAEWEPGDFYDFEHMTPNGAAKLGRRIAERMESLPW